MYSNKQVRGLPAQSSVGLSLTFHLLERSLPQLLHMAENIVAVDEGWQQLGLQLYGVDLKREIPGISNTKTHINYYSKNANEQYIR